MRRVGEDIWLKIREEREAGASFGVLSRKYRIPKSTIIRRSQIEKWGDGQNISAVIRRRVAEKLTGLLPVIDPKKRAAAIDLAAEQRAALVRKHQAETDAVRERLEAGLAAHRAATNRPGKILAFEDLKAAKISAEVLAILQRLERINWGLEDASPTPQIIIERSYGRRKASKPHDTPHENLHTTH